jgi:hypothetical protein
VGADLFISYAWTTAEHREWVRLIASSLKAIGYDVLIDADLDYGNGLNGFMRRATSCRHVLLVVDENYVDRADNVPGSGVEIENRAIADEYDSKPAAWLLVIFKDNPHCRLPAWLADHKPKGLDFNADPARDSFPGSEQVEDLWRWIEELPANRDHQTSVTTLRKRARRLEELDRKRDPNSWTSPSVEGELFFEYEHSPDKSYQLGLGEYGFKFEVSGHEANSVYVYRDKIHAVGINRSRATSHDELAAQLSPGRNVVAAIGDQAILQNRQGVLCIVDILQVQRETTSGSYRPASLTFRYRILMDS